MSDTPNVAPAGAGEQQPTTPTGPMGMSAAAQVLAGLDDTPEQAEAAPESAAQETIDENLTPSEDAAEDAAPIEEAEDAAPDESAEDAEPADDAEPEAEPEEDQYVHGNARTRLSDGTVTTVGELKKLAAEAKEYRAKMPNIAAAEQQLQARQAQIAQQEQFVQTVLPQAVQILKAYIPPPPDPELLNPNSAKYDTFLHYEQQARHAYAIAELQQLQGAQEAHAAHQRQQADQAAEAARRERVVEGGRILREKIPDIADPEKAKAIYEGFVSTAERFGYTAADVDGVDDPRLLHMVHELSVGDKALRAKAAAYDKLMAQQKKAQPKVQSAPPVQKPGVRASVGQAGDRQLDGKFQKWREGGGGMAGAAEILSLAIMEK
jgi:chemotaxis protein histidine kinase CheA